MANFLLDIRIFNLWNIWVVAGQAGDWKQMWSNIMLGCAIYDRPEESHKKLQSLKNQPTNIIQYPISNIKLGCAIYERPEDTWTQFNPLSTIQYLVSSKHFQEKTFWFFGTWRKWIYWWKQSKWRWYVIQTNVRTFFKRKGWFTASFILDVIELVILEQNLHFRGNNCLDPRL